jgi:Putative zinc-finger
MTTRQHNDASANEHADLQSLIPEYINGTLTAPENTMMKQHLADCEICRKQVSGWAFLGTHLPEAAQTWKPSPMHFANILAQVDQLEAATVKPASLKSSSATPGLFQRIGGWFMQTPNPVRWMVALETLAIAALAVFVMLPVHLKTGVGGVFETLSNAEPPTRPSLPIRVMFAGDMTTQELFGLLKQARAQIRQGPSVVGSYTVEVPAEDMADALAMFRAHPKVELAQPTEKSPVKP